MENKLSRRQFLRTGAIGTVSAAVSLGFLGCSRALIQKVPGFRPELFEFAPTANQLLDLPQGFIAHAFSRTGEEMDDGLWVPGGHDGMAAFPGPNGKTLLVRNHELQATSKNAGAFGWNNEKIEPAAIDKFYDAGSGELPCLGGTTTLVYDTRTQTLEKHFLSLTGTIRNCAGGLTPWGTWLTCEETIQKAEETYEVEHGYNFEVPASTDIKLADPIPLKAMGRFNHEAVAVDPRSGIVYQTEDRGDGLIYRFIPDKPGELAAGGKLQALKIRGIKEADTRNWRNRRQSIFRWTYNPMPVGETVDVEWVDIENVESPEDDLRIQGTEDKGAAKFARGEGIWYGSNSDKGEFYIACTNGGIKRKGQIWKYVPSPYEGTSREEQQPGRLQLFIEPNDSNLMENADNVTVTPWGDLIICEDGPNEEFLIGVTPEGNLYRFARNAGNLSELAGATFSPDGTTLFVNIQSPGITLAITGPWHEIRQRSDTLWQKPNSTTSTSTSLGS